MKSSRSIFRAFPLDANLDGSLWQFDRSYHAYSRYLRKCTYIRNEDGQKMHIMISFSKASLYILATTDDGNAQRRKCAYAQNLLSKTTNH